MLYKKIKKSLESLNRYWKQIVTVSLVLFCVISLSFCFVKITYALLTKPIPSSGPSKWSQQKKFNASASPTLSEQSTSKEKFVLQLKNFEPFTEQSNLKEHQKYSVLKVLDPQKIQLQCLLGQFELLTKKENSFSFSPINIFSGKKFEYYADFVKKQIKFMVLESDQIPTNILNCKEWLFLENTYENDTQTTASANITYKIKKPKCIQIPSKIISARSQTPNILYFKYNSFSEKASLCLQKHGIGIIETLEMNGSNAKIFRVSIDPTNK